MKDLLVYILDNILEENTTSVTETSEDGFTTYTIYAPQDQIGRIIGKSGKTINSIKNLLKIKAIKDGIKIDVQVAEQQ